MCGQSWLRPVAVTAHEFSCELHRNECFKRSRFNSNAQKQRRFSPWHQSVAELGGELKRSCGQLCDRLTRCFAARSKGSLGLGFRSRLFLACFLGRVVFGTTLPRLWGATFLR